MHEASPPADEADHCACCADAQAELRRLRARVARLEAEKEALVRSAIARDYEPPPHYR